MKVKFYSNTITPKVVQLYKAKDVNDLLTKKKYIQRDFPRSFTAFHTVELEEIDIKCLPPVNGKVQFWMKEDFVVWEHMYNKLISKIRLRKGNLVQWRVAEVLLDNMDRKNPKYKVFVDFDQVTGT